MATKTTIEVPVEEQITTTNFVEKTNDQETEVETVSEVEQPEAEAASELTKLTKEEVLALLAEKVESETSTSLRNEVEALKVAFYKLHRADMEARRKAFYAENGEDAEYTPQTDEAEVRFKELYNIYRTKRDEALALSDKEKEANYAAKLAVIEELKQLIDSEEALNTTFAKFHELQARWRSIGQVAQSPRRELLRLCQDK